MCDACKELSKIYDASQHLMVSKFTNAKTGEPNFILCQEKNGEADAVTIAVNYCPWCGKFLKGRRDNNAAD